ncbi:hypothetical protein [Micromonospora sp. NPDC047730]|uniref:hypothetical protein n=1 Tax=Micromonospora sp. NPDC047730 TaxID=3364253 RepID=UPI00371AAD96
MGRTFVEIGEATYRGRHPLPHQSRQIRRDLHGEDILMNPGAEARGYRLTAEQIEDRRQGRTPRAEAPYEFLIYFPGRPSLNWTAFYSRAELDAWLDAYALTLDGDPEPGGYFEVRLPATDADWQPATLATAFETLDDLRRMGAAIQWKGTRHLVGQWSATHDDGKLTSASVWSKTERRWLTLVEPRGLPIPEHQRCAATHPDFPEMRCERHVHPDTPNYPNHVTEHQNGLNKWESWH